MPKASDNYFNRYNQFVKDILETYEIKKIKNGLGIYAVVTLKVSPTSTPSKVVDAFDWKMGKSEYNDFKVNGPFIDWKNASIEVANQLIQKSLIPQNVEITITDIMGRYVDTTPNQIKEVTIRGVFDQCGIQFTTKTIEELLK